jgi:hypothetical protein
MAEWIPGLLKSFKNTISGLSIPNAALLQIFLKLADGVFFKNIFATTKHMVEYCAFIHIFWRARVRWPLLQSVHVYWPVLGVCWPLLGVSCPILQFVLATPWSVLAAPWNVLATPRSVLATPWSVMDTP